MHPYAHRRCVDGRDQEARGIVDEAAKENPHTKGPNAHFHKAMSESFCILAGTVLLVNGERWIDARAGDFLYVPEGGIHGFHNESDEPASMLLLFAPGAPREGYFEALAEKAAGRRFSDEEWKDICLRH